MMLNRRRRSLQVFAYFVVELVVVALAFFAAYEIRRRLGIGIQLDALRAYLWMLPASVAIWAAFLWIPDTYEGFRSRSLLMHAAASAATSALGVLALYALVTMFKQYYVHRSLIGVFGQRSRTAPTRRLICSGLAQPIVSASPMPPRREPQEVAFCSTF